MNQKVYHTLEYYKILDRLADYASCEEAKDRCHKLVPLTDPAEIAHLQETTADALSRLYRGSGIAAVLSGKTKSQTMPLRHFLKSVNPSGG